jgi:spoIIIJ-associated protein
MSSSDSTTSPQNGDSVNEIEAEGETVGEAKWAALRELERRFPGLDKTTVELVVLAEGERGLLGVGFSPARVLARVPVAASEPASSPPPAPVRDASTPAAERLRELLERVCKGLDLDLSVAIGEQGETLVGTFSGRDLGLVIGKHGQTIDALQYLANAVLARWPEGRIEVVLDAAGYRDRRRAVLEAAADRAAARVLSTGSSVSLDPMTASERKIVHIHLKDRSGVATASDGADPNRHVVVRPAE